jgi:hypothetical protein
MKKKEIERRWELETKKMIIPTVAEIMRKEKITWEEAAKRCVIICGNEHKKNDIDCHRKINGYSICKNCPKYQEEQSKTGLEWLEIQTKVW